VPKAMGESTQDSLPVGEVDYHQGCSERSPEGASPPHTGLAFHEPAAIEVCSSPTPPVK